MNDLAHSQDVRDNVANLSCSAISALASFWLFVSIACLPKHRRATLLARQLLHLSLADTVAFATLATESTFKVLWGENLSSGSDNGCLALQFGSIGTVTAALLEVHIAVAALLAIFRCTKVLAQVTKTVIAVWPIGIAAAVANTFLWRPYWNAESKNCVCKHSHESDGGKEWTLWHVVMAVSVMISLFVYVLAIAKLRTSSSGPRFRAFNKVLLLLGVNVLTVGPMCVRTFLGLHIPYVASTPFMLGGFANACVYTILNRHLHARFQKGGAGADAQPPQASQPLQASLQVSQCSIASVDLEQELLREQWRALNGEPSEDLLDLFSEAPADGDWSEWKDCAWLARGIISATLYISSSGGVGFLRYKTSTEILLSLDDRFYEAKLDENGKLYWNDGSVWTCFGARMQRRTNSPQRSGLI